METKLKSKPASSSTTLFRWAIIFMAAGLITIFVGVSGQIKILKDEAHDTSIVHYLNNARNQIEFNSLRLSFEKSTEQLTSLQETIKVLKQTIGPLKDNVSFLKDDTVFKATNEKNLINFQGADSDFHFATCWGKCFKWEEKILIWLDNEVSVENMWYIEIKHVLRDLKADKKYNYKGSSVSVEQRDGPYCKITRLIFEPPILLNNVKRLDIELAQ